MDEQTKKALAEHVRQVEEENRTQVAHQEAALRQLTARTTLGPVSEQRLVQLAEQLTVQDDAQEGAVAPTTDAAPLPLAESLTLYPSLAGTTPSFAIASTSAGVTVTTPPSSPLPGPSSETPSTVTPTKRLPPTPAPRQSRGGHLRQLNLRRPTPLRRQDAIRSLAEFGPALHFPAPFDAHSQSSLPAHPLTSTPRHRGELAASGPQPRTPQGPAGRTRQHKPLKRLLHREVSDPTALPNNTYFQALESTLEQSINKCPPEALLYCAVATQDVEIQEVQEYFPYIFTLLLLVHVLYENLPVSEVSLYEDIFHILAEWRTNRPHKGQTRQAKLSSLVGDQNTIYTVWTLPRTAASQAVFTIFLTWKYQSPEYTAPWVKGCLKLQFWHSYLPEAAPSFPTYSPSISPSSSRSASPTTADLYDQICARELPDETLRDIALDLSEGFDGDQTTELTLQTWTGTELEGEKNPEVSISAFFPVIPDVLPFAANMAQQQNPMDQVAEAITKMTQILTAQQGARHERKTLLPSDLFNGLDRTKAKDFWDRFERYLKYQETNEGMKLDQPDQIQRALSMCLAPPAKSWLESMISTNPTKIDTLEKLHREFQKEYNEFGLSPADQEKLYNSLAWNPETDHFGSHCDKIKALGHLLNRSNEDILMRIKRSLPAPLRMFVVDSATLEEVQTKVKSMLDMDTHRTQNPNPTPGPSGFSDVLYHSSVSQQEENPTPAWSFNFYRPKQGLPEKADLVTPDGKSLGLMKTNKYLGAENRQERAMYDLLEQVVKRLDQISTRVDAMHTQEPVKAAPNAAPAQHVPTGPFHSGQPGQAYYPSPSNQQPPYYGNQYNTDAQNPRPPQPNQTHQDPGNQRPFWRRRKQQNQNQNQNKGNGQKQAPQKPKTNGPPPKAPSNKGIPRTFGCFDCTNNTHDPRLCSRAWEQFYAMQGVLGNERPEFSKMHQEN